MLQHLICSHAVWHWFWQVCAVQSDWLRLENNSTKWWMVFIVFDVLCWIIALMTLLQLHCKNVFVDVYFEFLSTWRYASAVLGMALYLSVCLYVSVTSWSGIKTTEWIELVLGVGAAFDLSYTVLYKHPGTSKNKDTSVEVCPKLGT